MIGLSTSEIRLCRLLGAHCVLFWEAKAAILDMTGTQKKVNDECDKIRQLLTTVGKSNNVHLLIMAERIMCGADLKSFQDTQEKEPDDYSPGLAMSSLREGVVQMDEINEKLAARAEDIEAFHRYSTVLLRKKADHDNGGLPKDGIRRLLPSHRTRLDNLSKGWFVASGNERGLLRIRKSNIEQAEQAYKGLQREALGGAGPWQDFY